MNVATFRFNWVARAGITLRLVTILLAAWAVLTSQQDAGPILEPLAAGYAAVAVLWLLASSHKPGWLTYPVVLVDLAFVTALVASSASSLPLWMLYLPALAPTVMKGPLLAIGALCLSVVAYLVSTWWTFGMIVPTDLWSAAVLATIAFAMVMISVQSVAERREKRFWQELAAAAKGLHGSGSPEEVAEMIVVRARRLVGARGAWLWWCGADGSLLPGSRVEGTPHGSKSHLGLEPLASMLAWKLDRAAAQPLSFDEPVANLSGEAIALPQVGRRLALLVVGWDRAPADRPIRRQRLRVFARWSAEALIQAEARAVASSTIRRDGVLRQAASELAAAADREGVRDIVAEASASAGVPVTWLDNEPSARDEDKVAARLVGIDDESTLVVGTQDDRPIDVSTLEWLEQLAAVARKALGRCQLYEQQDHELRWLRACLEATPAPLSIRDRDGVLRLSSAALRGLGVEDMPGGEPSVPGRESELVVGDPPRTFVAHAVRAEGGYTVAVYREITREREALRSKDELIAIVGHELRGPLTSIQGYSQMMAHQIGIVQRQVLQLNRLIGDLMDASRIADGHLAITRETVDVAELARLAAERFRGAHEKRMLRLDLAEVPPIEGDAERLGQVVDNLLSNAEKYSPPEQEIVLSVRLRQDEVVLSVQDHEAGIAIEHIPHLFERFYRAPNSEIKKTKGLGLGLSIVRDLVVAHGGRVWAESQGEGLGATFWVCLPVPSDE